MKAHKIIGSIGVLTINQLQALEMGKGDSFANLEGGSFDWALPQDWLNDFANWCKTSRLCKDVTYDMIRSTTVWHYPASGNSEPVTCCREVYLAYTQYERILCQK